MMILTIDVGNTNIKIGAFRDGSCDNIWRLSTGQRRTSDEYGLFAAQLLQADGIGGAAGSLKGAIDGAIISSVVPDVTRGLARGIQKYFDVTPLVVSHKMKMGLKFTSASAREIGADRLVNCVAVRAEYQSAAIIVDYGTAVKYDVLSGDGEFITGITAPGVEISADALFEKAALIGKVELRLPPTIVAANTAESVQAGVLFGKIGEAEYIIGRLKRELGLADATVIATGGLSGVIAPGTDCFDVVDPFLTLKGLYALYEQNKAF